MTFGVKRVRNWGKESQQIALSMLLDSRRVAFKIHKDVLFLAPSHKGTTLPFEAVANLSNVRRGRWEARHVFDDRMIASGVSIRDVVRATIQQVWQ